VLINILTVFPEMFSSPFNASIIKRARGKGLLELNLVNIRDFSENKHKSIDDSPFGGGQGMVMSAVVFFKTMDWLKETQGEQDRVVLLSPGGRQFNQKIAWELSLLKRITLICGHYEGIDQRVREIASDEVSIGDYILTGGEIPSMVIIDAVARLIPGVLGKDKSACEESFNDLLLEYPQYTRPREHGGFHVPEVLLSGHHESIRYWRRQQSLLRTLTEREDLLSRAALTDEDKKILKEIFQRLKKLNLE